MLVKAGMKIEAGCLLCDCQNESVNHLFFECQYSRKCLEQVMKWAKWNCAARTLETCFKWIKKAKISVVKRRILYAILGATVYQIWHARNVAVWESKVWSIQHTVRCITSALNLRILHVLSKKTSIQDREWAESLSTV